MGTASVQIVEGNPHLRSLLGWHLQQDGYRVYQAGDVAHARPVFQTHQPHLVILDSQLPDGDGLDLCQWFQSQGQPLILILSARSTETDIVRGLKAGADDYLTKPFGRWLTPFSAPCRT